MKEIGRVHGKHTTYVVKEDSTWSGWKYYVRTDDGKQIGSYSSRADAFRAAHEKAGPGAYESK